MLVGEAGLPQSGAIGHREGRRHDEGLRGGHAGCLRHEDIMAYVTVAADHRSSMNARNHYLKPVVGAGGRDSRLRASLSAKYTNVDVIIKLRLR